MIVSSEKAKKNENFDSTFYSTDVNLNDMLAVQTSHTLPHITVSLSPVETEAIVWHTAASLCEDIRGDAVRPTSAGDLL